MPEAKFRTWPWKAKFLRRSSGAPGWASRAGQGAAAASTAEIKFWKPGGGPGDEKKSKLHVFIFFVNAGGLIPSWPERWYSNECKYVMYIA